MGYKKMGEKLSSKSHRQGLRGDRLKKRGGRGEGLDWCMTKTGVRYIRILDLVNVLSARGRQGVGNEEDDQPYQSPIKKYLISFRII